MSKKYFIPSVPKETKIDFLSYDIKGIREAQEKLNEEICKHVINIYNALKLDDMMRLE